MASIDAENVAKEVSETLGKGEKVILGEIIRKHGYADSTSETPSNVTNTKSYQEVIKPIVNRWIKERERLTTELEGRNLTEEKYETVVKSIDLITKNIQLLSGGATDVTKVLLIDKELAPLYGIHTTSETNGSSQEPNEVQGS